MTAEGASVSQPNEKLDSFDAVLEAMERELVSEREKHAPSIEMEVDDDDELNEEDAELLQQLLASGASLPESLQRFSSENGVADTDLNALASFLESFKAQGGHAGPVTNLAGRLGVGALPRDTDAPSS